MAKSKKQNRYLRREIEILKAQLSVEKGVKIKNEEKELPAEVSKVTDNIDYKSPESTSINLESENTIIRADLIKSFILGAFAIAVIASLWAYEQNILPRV